MMKEPVPVLTNFLFIHLTLIHFLVKSYDPSENQRNSHQVFRLKYRDALGRISIFERLMSLFFSSSKFAVSSNI